MNQVLLLNLAFYLCPYVAMIFHDLSPQISDRLKHTLNQVFTFLLGVGILFSIGQLLILRYYEDGVWAEILGFIPPYLAAFYSLSVALCVYALYKKGPSYYHSLSLGFIIAYVSSFYWELPENIFWQLKRGYHPTIIFVLLGVFPYIWLDKKLGWERSLTNILLVLLGWAVTLYGVMTMESNIYTTPTGGIYFLFCRVVCLSILIKIFILDRGCNR